MVAMTKVPSTEVLPLLFRLAVWLPHHGGDQPQHRQLKPRGCLELPCRPLLFTHSFLWMKKVPWRLLCRSYLWSGPPSSRSLSVVVFHWMFPGNWEQTTEPGSDMLQMKLPADLMS